MSAREWKPGDVMTFGDGSVRGFRTDDGWTWIDGSTSPDGVLYGDMRRLAVIDPADGSAAARLAYLLNDTIDAFVRVAVVRDALREFANPPLRRVWTDGDVVQHIDGNYTAQRHDGEWRTTTGGKGDSKGWGSDEYVTNHVEAGRLRVLREQAAEVQS